jgi:hypothetical protein
MSPEEKAYASMVGDHRLKSLACLEIHSASLTWLYLGVKSEYIVKGNRILRFVERLCGPIYSSINFTFTFGVLKYGFSQAPEAAIKAFEVNKRL